MSAASPLKTMQTLYKALLLGQVIFWAVAIWARQRNLVPQVDIETDRALQLVAVVLAFGLIWAALAHYRKKVAALADGDLPTGEKLKAYQTVSIIKWAMTEVPCLFCGVSYLLTANWAFMALAAVILFVFAGYNPQRQLVMRELKLGGEDLG
jgi:K+ transporter